MKLLILLSALAAGTASLIHTHGALAEEYSFKTPSENIFCSYYDYSGVPEVRCDIRNFTPAAGERPADCDLEWGDAFVVAADKSVGSMICHGDTVISPEAKVLSYGSTFAKGGIACASERTGLTCKNDEGHGFSLSRAKQYAF